ncbi:hypothetical protein MUP95_03365, partial [bacterium]|nr:hypothetical protein [bacterium]
TSEAVKRLRTIEEFTELGSGFQIALRDLEIRGSGNILGVQQSGNINAVGFDLYMKLVEEAVQELKESEEKKREVVSPGEECLIVADLAAYLPESYVADASLRVNIYRKLSLFKQLSEIDILKEELRDRFGPIPKEAENLLDIAMIQLLGRKYKVERIVLQDEFVKIYFHKKWIERFISSEHISQKLRSIIDSTSFPIRFMKDKGFGLYASVPLSKSTAFTKKLLQSLD